MSSPHMYIEHSGDFDRTLVTVYTFAKYNVSPGSKLTVLEYHNLTTEQKLNLNDIYPTNFTSGALQIQYFMQNVENLRNITHRIFSRHNITGPEVDRTAVVCYIYWFDLAPKIINHIKKLSNDTYIDLYIYMCDVNSESHKQKVLDMFTDPQHNIDVYFEWVPNIGRDIWSFLKFIVDDKYQKYKNICKIHTKKSTYLDDDWCDKLLTDLLDPINAKRHYQNLNQSNISSCPVYDLWEISDSRNPNYDYLTRIMNMYDKPLTPNQRYRFGAGTMFWCTTELCRVVNTKMSINYIYEFEPEPISGDGTLAHAWERAFHILS